MKNKKYNGGVKIEMPRIINDSDISDNIFPTFYHYKLIIDKINNKIGLSIMSLDNNVIFEKQEIQKNFFLNSDIINSFYIALAKGSRGILQLTNISVYT